MPLTPPEQAAFTLRVAGATHLDSRAKPLLGDQGRAELNLRSTENEAAAQRAAMTVSDAASAKQFLAEEIERLEGSLKERRETEETRQAVRRHFEALRLAERKSDSDQNADGPCTSECLYGIMPFAWAVETHVARTYEAYDALPIIPEMRSISRPAIWYKTLCIPDIPKKMGAFNFCGRADISKSPALVELFIRNGVRLYARDLWQLAYVLHHELVCHGFQFSAAVGTVHENAPAGCHWSEGWMDAVAFSVATRWTHSPDCVPCFGFGGSFAVSSMDEMHRARYPNPDALRPEDKVPAGLSEGDAYLRYAAREAFDALSIVLSALHDQREAHDMALRFSLRLNAHREASPKRLRDVCTRLLTALLNDIRGEAAGQAAAACVEFAARGDLEQLELALSAI